MNFTMIFRKISLFIGALEGTLAYITKYFNAHTHHMHDLCTSKVNMGLMFKT